MKCLIQLNRREQHLDATFERARQVDADTELLSDFAKYLCILVSGYLEQASIEILIEVTRLQSAPRVQRHIESRLHQLTNFKTQRLVDLFRSFDPDWGIQLDSFLIDEYKDAINSIVDNRNTIAHGGNVGITVSRVLNYYTIIKKVVKKLNEMCLTTTK